MRIAAGRKLGPLDVGYAGDPLYRNVLVDTDVVQDSWPHTASHHQLSDDDERKVNHHALWLSPISLTRLSRKP
jgi:hypothetical protein